MRCMRPYEVDETLRPDFVIVTILWDLDSITEEMHKLFRCEIYSILEVIEGILESETLMEETRDA